MVVGLCLLRFRTPFIKIFDARKLLSTLNSDDIVFNSICMNLRQKRWVYLEQVSSVLTDSLVDRVIWQFRRSPQLALDFFNWAEQQKGYLHNLKSYSTLVHVLINSRRFEDGLSIMRYLMQRKGVPVLDFLQQLINSYDICASSQAVFDSLVRYCTQAGATEDAYVVIERLRIEGCGISIHAWNNFLNHLLKLNDVARFWKMYKEMISRGYIGNMNTMNLVIYVLCREFKFWEAISVFYWMLKSGIKPNVVTFNMLIDGCCKIGEVELASKLLKKMEVMSGKNIKPNQITFNCLIHGFCRAGKLTVAEETWEHMHKMGFEPDVRTYATMVDGYLRVGKMEVAFQLCDKMEDQGLTPSVVVYNSLINWLLKEGDIKEVFFLLSDMIKKHIQPDHITYSILICGFCKNGNPKEALEYFSILVEENNLVKDTAPYNIFINYLCKNRNVKEAMQLISAMFTRGLILDLVTYSTLIDGYCKEGKIPDAIQIYDEMVKARQRPNLVIYNSVVNGLCRELLLDKARAMVDEMRISLLGDIITFNTMLNGYLNALKVEDAYAFVQEMRHFETSANEVTYNILLKFMCKFGCIQHARKLLNFMLDKGIIPDCITYTTLITEVRKHCSPHDLVELHDFMVLRGAVPDENSCSRRKCKCLNLK